MTAPSLICIIGAECTGKTTLARALAEQFDCLWVAEYLREFCGAQGRTPTRVEQRHILETQHAHERAAQRQAKQRAKPFVFCDTAPLLTAIYSDFIFGDASLYARARALHSRYALTLLLAPNIAWVADGLQRDGAQVRLPVTHLLERELSSLGVPLVTVTAQDEGRMELAKDAVEALTSGSILWRH